MISALFLAAFTASCPIVVLPQTDDRNEVCVDCRTEQEVACKSLPKRTVYYKQMTVFPDRVRYSISTQRTMEGHWNTWTCELTYEQFASVKIGEVFACEWKL